MKKILLPLSAGILIFSCVKNIKDVSKRINEIQLVEVDSIVTMNGKIDGSQIIRFSDPCPKNQTQKYFVADPNELKNSYGNRSTIWTERTQIEVTEVKTFNCEKQTTKVFKLPADYKALLKTFAAAARKDIENATIANVKIVKYPDLMANADYAAARKSVDGNVSVLGFSGDLRKPMSEVPQGYGQSRSAGRQMHPAWAEGYDLFLGSTAGRQYLTAHPQVGALKYTLGIAIPLATGQEEVESQDIQYTGVNTRVFLKKMVWKNEPQVKINISVSAQMANQEDAYLFYRSRYDTAIKQSEEVVCNLDTNKCEKNIEAVVKNLTAKTNSDVLALLQEAFNGTGK